MGANAARMLPRAASTGAAAVEEVMGSINAACRARGGKYAQYSCKVVSWDDVSRGVTGSGELSCWGANITDTYLKSKDGQQLFTVRSDNWNEKLGKVSTSEVALVAGENGPKGELRPRTLSSVLKEMGRYGAYAGLSPDKDLSDIFLDAECSIRFQTTFLPVTGKRGALQVATEAYNYNTRSDADPRNLLLLCTTQGLAVQQDGAGGKQLFHHAVDDDGVIHRYWLEAERTEHKVGGPQQETAEEKAEALERGKATASVIGIKAMGQRFNVLMTIQVPLQQRRPEFRCLTTACESAPIAESCMQMSEARSLRRRSRGVSNAARVSRGSEVDTWAGLTVQNPQRNKNEHVTITVVMYNTVADGVPSEEDVAAAIDDLESLYEACSVSGRLADREFDFMKQPLTAKDLADIQAKIVTQPYGADAAPTN